MKDVPEPEEALAEREGRRLLYGRYMKRHQLSDACKPPPPNLSRPSEPPALDHNGLPRIGNQPYANEACSHANHRNQQEAGENAVRGNRPELRKSAQLFDNAIGDGQVGSDSFLQRVRIGQDFPQLRLAAIQPEVKSCCRDTVPRRR